MFNDRKNAGMLLGKKLSEYKGNSGILIVALPRGGVIVARETADILKIPFVVLPVKKLSAPGNPELAIGAVTLSGVKYLNWDLIEKVNADKDFLEDEIGRKQDIVSDQAILFKTDPKIFAKYHRYIIIDDGIATGATVRAAVLFLKKVTGQKREVIIATPAIANDVQEELRNEAEGMVFLISSADFRAVGQYYRRFPQVSDWEVIKNLPHNKSN